MICSFTASFSSSLQCWEKWTWRRSRDGAAASTTARIHVASQRGGTSATSSLLRLGISRKGLSGTTQI
uniref:Uncharacterized protein n=1 Tax=Oryza meridionalis TaxID=40149 RepID=A0A0E0DU98_9ORYZ